MSTKRGYPLKGESINGGSTVLPLVGVGTIIVVMAVLLVALTYIELVAALVEILPV